MSGDDDRFKLSAEGLVGKNDRGKTQGFVADNEPDARGYRREVKVDKTCFDG